MELEAEGLATKGLAAAGFVRFNGSLLQARKIRGIFKDNVVGDACIKPSNGEFYDIYYQHGLPITKLRFSIAHEIGHTYWFAPGGGAKPLSPLQRRLGRDPGIEYLCNLFAEAILLPRTLLLHCTRDLLKKHESNDIPLHIIPTLSTRFRVAEQAVARRLFSSTDSALEAIVCLRLSTKSSKSSSPESANDTRWVTSWCSIINNSSYNKEQIPGFSTPLRRSGRNIPFDMIPELPEGQTITLYLDGRWWEGLKKQPSHIARIPLDRVPPKQVRAGYASRIGERIYLALPSESLPE
ncbi:MAG: ImmA/IrrE family metallo-endopeptidase [Acidobacteriota bacterium]|nr:ImmA/IrrE family metallo-endopeptidase [Acidobacteriota bacterium]